MGGRGAKSKVNRKQKRQNGRMKGGWAKQSSWSKKSKAKEMRSGHSGRDDLLKTVIRGFNKGKNTAGRH